MSARPPRVPIFVPIPLVLLAFGLAGGCDREDGAPGAPSSSLLTGELLAPPAEPTLTLGDDAHAGPRTPLRVVAARPTGLVKHPEHPTVTFSKPVIALATLDRHHELPAPARLTPDVPGEWRWVGSATLEFVPTAAWPLSTEFQVEVPAGLTALDGSRLAEPFSLRFATPGPQVLGATPREGDRWVEREPRFVLHLNQPVADLLAHTRLLVDGQVVPLALVREVDVAEEQRQQRLAEAGARPGALPEPAVAPPDLGFAQHEVRYELAPVAPLPPDASLTWTVAASLPARGKAATLGSPLTRQVRTYGPLTLDRLQGCLGSHNLAACSSGPLYLSTSNVVALTSLQGRLKIEPEVTIDWENATSEGPSLYSPQRTPWVKLPGPFRAGTEYRVEISPGVTDVFGQVTTASASFSFRYGDLAPRFALGPSFALLEAAGEAALPVESVNLTRGRAEVWTLEPAELARLLAWEEGPRGRSPRPLPLRPPAVLALELGATRNRVQVTPLALRRVLPDAARHGLFFVRATAPELKNERGREPVEEVAAQVTDLAVHAKLGPVSGLVWVTSLATGKPVSGAELQLYDRQGEVRWQGRSTGDGVARLPGLEDLVEAEGGTWDTPFALVAARQGPDVGVTVSTWSEGLWPGSFDVRAGWDGKRPESLGLLFAERGIYRPGDRVWLKGISRYLQLGELRTPPAGLPVQLTVHDPEGRKLVEHTLKFSDFGTFSTQIDLPAEAALGGWSVQATATLDEEDLSLFGSFRVAEYRAPSFRVDVDTSRTALVAGDPVGGTVDARYLYGAPLAGARVTWSLSRTTTEFAPPGQDGFSFGQQLGWWDDEEPGTLSGVCGGGAGEIDPQGLFPVVGGLAETPGTRSYEYTLEAEVTDVSRQRVAARSSFTVHPSSLHGGVKLVEDGFARAGQPLAVQLVAAHADGTRQAGVALTLDLLRREWTSIREQEASGEWVTRSEPVETKVTSCTQQSALEPVTCSFVPAQPGLYVLQLSLADAQGRATRTRTSLYVVGEGWVAWQRQDAGRLELVADRERYPARGVARILVKSPYPEAEALLTVEREGVRLARRVHLVGSATTLEVPLDESLVPNAFVGVLLVRGRVTTPEPADAAGDPGRPTVHAGYTELTVEPTGRRLQVELRPDGQEKGPRDRVVVKVRVADAAGRPQRAEVTLWAVDEAVLRLTGYTHPDPLTAFYPPRGLSVRIGEPLLHLVLAQRFVEKGETPGGSGGQDPTGAGIRSRFLTTVLWRELVTGADGEGEVAFELPDNLTTYRLMAVATTAAAHFGEAVSRVTVSKPLLLLPALPRFARVGDRFEAGVVVHGRDVPSAPLQVTLQATGLQVEGPATQEVSLVAGQPREVRFPCQVLAPGSAKLTFAVEGGGLRDALAATLPLHLPLSPEAVAAYGDTTSERQEGLVPPAAVRPDWGGLEVTLSSSVLGSFDETLRQLADYPYGCLEQLSSRLIPFVILEELRQRTGRDGSLDAASARELQAAADRLARAAGEAGVVPASATAADVVRLTAAAILRLQNEDGGFRFWAEPGCSTHSASAHAVLALGLVRDAGYELPAEPLQRGLAFLADHVAAGRSVDCGWGETRPDDATRILALHALARGGSPRASYYAELFARRAGLPLYAQALLAELLGGEGGERSLAQQLLGELLNSARESAGEVHFEETPAARTGLGWSSDLRTSAIVLGTLAKLAPDHPFVGGIARYLGRARGRDGRFRTTQEAAYALLALRDVIRTKEAELPDYTARLLLGDKELAAVPFVGNGLAMPRVELPTAELLGLGARPRPLVFRRDGRAGVLYYTALLRYAPAALPTQPVERGLTVQRWFEPLGGGGQTRRFPAGELVLVRVRVATSRERQYVVTEVPLPAGLEAVDTQLATTARWLGGGGSPDEAAGYEDERWADEEEAGPYAYSFFDPFGHKELRDDRVLLFADVLPPGLHLATFPARATTLGSFVLPPAQAAEMYAPETFGRSDGGTFLVVEGKQLAVQGP